MSIGKVEYRIRLVTRYEVTRYEESEGGATGSCCGKGEYGNNEIAFEVAYALCKAEHERLGWPLGDERIQYPERVYPELQIQADLAAAKQAAAIR